MHWARLPEPNPPRLWRYAETDLNGVLLEEATREMALRWTYRWELRHMLELCGFVVEAEYSDFHGAPPAYGKELVVVAPHGHRLANRQRVRMHELAGEHFISYREGARLRELLVAAGNRYDDLKRRQQIQRHKRRALQQQPFPGDVGAGAPGAAVNAWIDLNEAAIRAHVRDGLISSAEVVRRMRRLP